MANVIRVQSPLHIIKRHKLRDIIEYICIPRECRFGRALHTQTYFALSRIFCSDKWLFQYFGMDVSYDLLVRDSFPLSIKM